LQSLAYGGGMPDCLISLPLLNDVVEPQLDRFLELNARPRDRPGLKELYRRLSALTRKGDWPENLARLLGTTRSPTYKMFTQNASSSHARRRTNEWSDAVIGEPALTSREAAIVDLVDTNWAGGGGWVFKGGLVLRAGIQPIGVARTYRPEQNPALVLSALNRLHAGGHDVPVLTTRPDRQLVEVMLNLAARTTMKWTGRLSSQFEFQPSLLIQWLSPVPMQTLSVADALAAGAPARPGESGSFVWLQVDGRRWFVLYGPSRLGRYYLRSRVGSGKAAGEQAALLRLVDLIESRDLCLTDFAIERLRVLEGNEDSYRRVMQAILLLWRFPLQSPAVGRALPVKAEPSNVESLDIVSEN
jgi:hypothetical protein